MAARIYIGELVGPEGGPYRVPHNLGTREVTVSVRGYLSGDSLAVIEIPDELYTWLAETDDSVIVDTCVPASEELPDGGRLIANGMTVVVTPAADPAARGGPA